MHDRGAELIDLARIGFSSEVLPRGLVSFSDLVAIQEIARMLNQPWEETVMDGQLLAAPLFQIDEQGPYHLLDGLYGLFRLAIPLGITPGRMSENRSSRSSLSGHRLKRSDKDDS